MQVQTGFIGLGRMGLPMATNLAQAGYPLHVYDTAPAAREAAAKLPGATVYGSAGEVARHAQVLFTVLPNNDIVTETYLGADGIMANGAEGLITCDCSTVGPEINQRINAETAAKGIQHLDTPMLGSTPEAESGNIFFIVGGEKAALDTVAPLLEVMGKMHMHVGPSGAGNQIKLIHNALAAVTSVAVAESLSLAAKTGVDLETYYQVVINGGGMAYGRFFDRRVPRILSGDYTPAFALELMHKDASLAQKMARDAGLEPTFINEAVETYAAGKEAGWGGDDFSGVARVVEKRAGVRFSGE